MGGSEKVSFKRYNVAYDLLHMAFALKRVGKSRSVGKAVLPKLKEAIPSRDGCQGHRRSFAYSREIVGVPANRVLACLLAITDYKIELISAQCLNARAGF